MSALVDLTAGAVANTATKRGGVLPQKGTTAENDAYTGAVGEITYDETLSQYRVHDGATAGGVKIPAVGIAAPARGALVTLAANLTTQDYTTATAIPWTEENYDTDTIHDNATNNTRLTVPTGVTKVRLVGQLAIDDHTSGVFAQIGIYKGGLQDYQGSASQRVEITGTVFRLNVASPVLTVAATEYFELFALIETDASITVTDDQTWFAMEIIQ
jgi:hypothetical protein